MKTINNISFALISLLFLCIHPLQAAHDLSITSEANTIDAAPAADYQKITEKGVDEFEEYLLMLGKKCIETEKIKKGVVLVVGAMGSGKSTLICHLLGASLVGIRAKDNDGWDDSDDEDDQHTCYASIGIDPKNPPNFPVPKIGNNAAQPQTFLPGVFANPNVKNGLHYCDMPGFDDKRGKAEKAISAIAPALVLHSMQRTQAILAVIGYDSITAGKGKIFLKVITDVMTYFGHAPWEHIQKATFVCITKCGHLRNSDVKKALKDQIRNVHRILADKHLGYKQAINALKAHHTKGIKLDKHKKKAHEATVADYEDSQAKAKFFSIFAAIDQNTKEIILNKNKLLFSRPMHKKCNDYRTKIIKALKTSPGLEREHLSKCDYSNPMLTRQLTKVVGRMNHFLSRREGLRKENEDLRKSISNKQGISQQINNLQTQITDKYLESTKKSTDKSLVAIYKSLPYHRKFSRTERLKHWGIGALGGFVGAGIGFGAAAAAGGTLAAVEAGIAYNALGAAGGGAIGATIAKFSHNIKPYQRFVYSASVPVYQMAVRYGAGTFKSISPDGWQVNEASDNPKNQFTYQPNQVAVKYPVCYMYEYIGHFHTEGHCQVTLYSRYNELETTKQRVQILAQEIKNMQIRIKGLNNKKKSKENNIARNKKAIKTLDRCIRNTYENRAKDQDIAYARAKCAMLAFFVNKPLFNKDASVLMNDDNDEKAEEQEKQVEKKKKETDHPLLAEMNRCITQWKKWLSSPHFPPAQADDDEVFDID